MRYWWISALFLAAIPSGALSDDDQIDASKVFELLQAADGSVTVLIADDADPTLTDALVKMLSDSAVKNLRLGISDRVEGREAIRAVFDANFSSQDVLHFCSDWLTSNGPHEPITDFIITEFSGSLVVIDDGPNDRERFGPVLGDDPWSGSEENPILFGIFGSDTPWGQVQSADPYRAAWQTIDGLPLGLEVNGC